MRLFWGTCRRPARPCTGPHADTSRGGVVVLGTRSKAKEFSGTRSRRASSPGRSRAFWQNSLAGPVNEVTMVVVVVGTMSKRTRSRPWRRYPDPYQPLGTRGDAGSTRWRPRAPTSPYGDGTSPTVPGGAHSRPRWAGGTSSRDKLEVWLPRTGPYPSWGAAGPVGGGSRGAREGSAGPLIISDKRGGRGLKQRPKP